MGIFKNLFSKKQKEEPQLPPPTPPTGWRTVEGKDVYYKDNEPFTGVDSRTTGNRQHILKVYIGGERIGYEIRLGKGYQTLSNQEDGTRQHHALEAAQKALAEGKTDEFESIKAKAVEEYNTQKAARQKAQEQNKTNPAEKITEVRGSITASKGQEAPAPSADKTESAAKNEPRKYSNGKPAGLGFHTSYKGY